MKTEQEYIQDLTEIRSMMERSTKFLSLTGWSGIMAGIYALAGAFVAHNWLAYDTVHYVKRSVDAGIFTDVNLKLLMLAALVLALAVGTAAVLSIRKAGRSGQKFWNAAARRLLINMAIPLATGGICILIMLSKGLTAFVAPLTLIFYGLALFNAGKFTYEEIRQLGIFNIILGLLAAYFTTYGLLFWALGFGLMHIIYGIAMHIKYEK